MRTLKLLLVVVVLAAAPVLGALVSSAQASAPVPAVSTIVAKWKNCTVVNHRLPHGVGRSNAIDHTSGVRVTNFRHDTAMYKRAMAANRGLDRDRDGIACEKR